MIGANNMEHEFSDGFMQDIAFLLESCSENKASSTSLEFNIGGKELTIDMTFKIRNCKTVE